MCSRQRWLRVCHPVENISLYDWPELIINETERKKTGKSTWVDFSHHQTISAIELSWWMSAFFFVQCLWGIIIWSILYYYTSLCHPFFCSPVINITRFKCVLKFFQPKQNLSDRREIIQLEKANNTLNTRCRSIHETNFRFRMHSLSTHFEHTSVRLYECR